MDPRTRVFGGEIVLIMLVVTIHPSGSPAPPPPLFRQGSVRLTGGWGEK